MDIKKNIYQQICSGIIAITCTKTTIYVGKPPPGEESKPTGLTDPLQTSTVSTNGYKDYTSSNTFTIMQN